MTRPMDLGEAERYHAACKMIELDGCEGYFSCRERYGPDIAGMALIMWLRCKINEENGNALVRPDYQKLKNKVNEIMEVAGRFKSESTR